jgi:hypothetical protein
MTPPAGWLLPPEQEHGSQGGGHGKEHARCEALAVPLRDRHSGCTQANDKGGKEDEGQDPVLPAQDFVLMISLPPMLTVTVAAFP